MVGLESKIILAGLVLLAVSLSGCLGGNSKSPEDDPEAYYKECLKVAQFSDQDNVCNTDMAYLVRNFSYCDKINQNASRTECIKNVCWHINDQAEICKKYPSGRESK